MWGPKRKRNPGFTQAVGNPFQETGRGVKGRGMGHPGPRPAPLPPERPLQGGLPSGAPARRRPGPPAAAETSGSRQRSSFSRQPASDTAASPVKHLVLPPSPRGAPCPLALHLSALSLLGHSARRSPSPGTEPEPLSFPSACLASLPPKLSMWLQLFIFLKKVTHNELGSASAAGLSAHLRSPHSGQGP